MQKRKDSEGPFLGLGEGLLSFVDTSSRVLVWGGLAVFVVGLGFLLFAYSSASVANPDVVPKAVATFGPFAIWGGLVAAAGAAWLFWGEEILGPVVLAVGLALLFSQAYMPMIMPGGSVTGGPIMSTLSTAGIGIAAIGLICIIGDIISRMKTRSREGRRAEQLKYKGMKEERDIRNVFLGKCWQLPYCRKFVRERCPIYHTRRTCWKERVGCMCEETVINNAMQGRTIPKDIVAAAKFIPVNNKLTAQQKAARCNQCVIYNEHQKHRYKISVPLMAIGTVGLYFLIRAPLANAILGVFNNANKTINSTTGGKAVINTNLAPGFGIQDFLVAAVMFVVFAYALKFIENMFFRRV